MEEKSSGLIFWEPQMSVQNPSDEEIFHWIRKNFDLHLVLKLKVRGSSKDIRIYQIQK